MRDFWVKSITNLKPITMEVTWKLQRIRFEKWMESDNVIKIETDDTSYWSSQDALYRNRMHTIEDAWKYYQKEFITL
tara:strand:+ start:336 stop:566 length:231 start_codon:yes stop_codon:yes gene_type:complete